MEIQLAPAVEVRENSVQATPRVPAEPAAQVTMEQPRPQTPVVAVVELEAPVAQLAPAEMASLLTFGWQALLTRLVAVVVVVTQRQTAHRERAVAVA